MRQDEETGCGSTVPGQHGARTRCPGTALCHEGARAGCKSGHAGTATGHAGNAVVDNSNKHIESAVLHYFFSS